MKTYYILLFFLTKISILFPMRFSRLRGDIREATEIKKLIPEVTEIQKLKYITKEIRTPTKAIVVLLTFVPFIYNFGYHFSSNNQHSIIFQKTNCLCLLIPLSIFTILLLKNNREIKELKKALRENKTDIKPKKQWHRLALTTNERAKLEKTENNSGENTLQKDLNLKSINHQELVEENKVNNEASEVEDQDENKDDENEEDIKKQVEILIAKDKIDKKETIYGFTITEYIDIIYYLIKHRNQLDISYKKIIKQYNLSEDDFIQNIIKYIRQKNKNIKKITAIIEFIAQNDEEKLRMRFLIINGQTVKDSRGFILEISDFPLQLKEIFSQCLIDEMHASIKEKSANLYRIINSMEPRKIATLIHEFLTNRNDSNWKYAAEIFILVKSKSKQEKVMKFIHDRVRTRFMDYQKALEEEIKKGYIKKD